MRMRSFALLAFVVACNASPDASHPLIVGGVPVPPGGHPAVVGLAFNNHIECTGTLIAPSVVLTAGHCLVGNDVASRLTVYTGDGVEGGIVAAATAVERIVYHPMLRQHPLGNADLGLVILKQPLSDIAPLPIVTTLAATRAATAPGTAATLVGYGRREDNGKGVKYEVTTTVVRATSHEAVLGGLGKDACDGDSGGPALTTNAPGTTAVLGVVSRGLKLGCGDGGYVAITSDLACWIAAEGNLPSPPECTGSVPHYTPARLSSISFSRLCQSKTAWLATPTQRETVRALRLWASPAPGTYASCAATEAQLKATEILSLPYLMIRDLSPLAAFPQIRELDLTGNRITDLAPLAALPNLTTVRASGNAIADFTVLNGPYIFGTKKQLQNYAATTFFSLCGRAEGETQKTIKAILAKTLAEDCATANQRLLALKTLTLGERGLADLSPLADLQTVETLDLHGNPISDVTPLAGLENLKKLDLTGTSAPPLEALAPLVARGLVILTD